jgi:NADH:ubiquinone oxidoreductase subunit C
MAQRGQQTPAESEQEARVEQRSPDGDYRDSRAAAHFFREALRDDPRNLELQERAFVASVQDGSLPEGIAPERFEIVTVLRSLLDRAIIRIRVQVPEADPTIATLFDMYPGSEAMEREVYDMFGITFTDHPDLTRILMPEDWIGHPLRKDYDSGRIPVQFKGAPANR